MKARNENGKIRFYDKMPNKYKSEFLNIAGGFDKLDETVFEQEGFFDILTPEFDHEIQELGEVYFDEVNKVFTYPVTAKDLPSLEVAKKEKLAELKNAIRELYASIQWYVEMKRMNDEAIPTVLKDKIKTIKTKYELLKIVIMDLTTVVDVIKYQLPYAAFEILRSKLEEIE